MDKIRLHIKGLTYSQTQSGAYALVLGEEGGERRLPIIIGGFEAQSIAIALEKDVNPPRPLTHDLFKSFAGSFEITLKEVVIHKLQEGVFYSILLFDKDGEEKVMDARTSDAVALAIRFDCPVYTYPEILNQAGIILSESGNETEGKELITEEDLEVKDTSSSEVVLDYELADLDDLKTLLEQALKGEDYELAAKLRDEIDKRESN